MAKARKDAAAKRSASKKSAAKAASEPQKVVRQLTPEDDLNKLLRACTGHEKNIGEYVGSLREKIGYAVEKKHLHKKAFAQARREESMEPEILASFYDHLDHYRDVFGLIERAESAPSLDLGSKPGDEDEEEAETAPAKDDGKVTNLNKKRRTVGELMHEPGGALAHENKTQTDSGQAAVG